MKISLVQAAAAVGRPEQNTAKMESFIREASRSGSEIICFPEAFVQGYVTENPALYSTRKDSREERLIQAFAEKYDICILTGMLLQEDDRFFIAQTVFQKDKEPFYRKKNHLGKKEKINFSEGDSLEVHRHNGRTFGIQICWENHFPEITRILSAMGAEIVFAPHASPPGIRDRRELWLKYMPARAYDYSVYLAVCNQTGTDSAGEEAGGGIMVFDPKGNLVAEYFGKEEKMISFTTDDNLLKSIREENRDGNRNIFFLREEKNDLYEKYREVFR